MIARAPSRIREEILVFLAFGLLLGIGLNAPRRAKAVGPVEDDLPIPPYSIADVLPAIEPKVDLDARTVQEFEGALPEALPPSPTLPGTVSAPPPTAPGRFFERPNLVFPPSAYPEGTGVLPPGEVPTPGMIADPPITYLSSPRPSQVEDIEYRDGPRIPEPMVFDLVRGLGARQGELEINVLNLVPFRPDGRTRYEWAPEIEYAVFDGFAVEFELPIFNTEIEAVKFAAQYTFGTAFDDAFIHGIQGISQYNFEGNNWATAVLYLAGIRLSEKWSLFGMFGFNSGELVFPFDDFTPRQGLDVLVNLSAFYEITDDFLVGVETNVARAMLGSGDILIMPQFHWHLTENYTLQFGLGIRDDGLQTFPELGFRLIWER